MWGKELQETFEMLRNKLLEASILAHPNITKPFLLAIDASGYAIGAVLGQIDDK